MYYITSIRFKAACELRWYSVTAVLKYVHELRDFILQGNSKLSSVYLPTLPFYVGSELFDLHKRFPENTYYICEGIGSWNFRMQRLQLLSSIATNANRLQRHYEGISTLGSTEVAILVDVDDILSAIEAADFLVDRIEFENRYQLTWEPNENNTDTDREDHLPK
ncbi:unnamed protein product [Absidia cylindrospora]